LEEPIFYGAVLSCAGAFFARFKALVRPTNKWEFSMATQIVMDRSGDTRHSFDPGDCAAVAEAEQRFMQLTGAGFTAAVRTAPGEQRVIRSFDPTAEETLFHPRLVGG
jgi:hypothetical protein